MNLNEESAELLPADCVGAIGIHALETLIIVSLFLAPFLELGVETQQLVDFLTIMQHFDHLRAARGIIFIVVHFRPELFEVSLLLGGKLSCYLDVDTWALHRCKLGGPVGGCRGLHNVHSHSLLQGLHVFLPSASS